MTTESVEAMSAQTEAVERFDFFGAGWCGNAFEDAAIEPCADGEYVRFKDYASLLASRDSLQAECAQLRERNGLLEHAYESACLALDRAQKPGQPVSIAISQGDSVTVEAP